MNKLPRISVIVPVYNVEKYLRRCVDSILSQSQQDFELLLIDDGSKDESGDICDEYAAKDLRIKVFHKTNGGVSSARNLGLDNAQGEWVAFVDADDDVEEEYLSIREQFDDSDVVNKPYLTIYEDKTEMSLDHGIVTLNDRDSIFRYYVRKRNNALWDKLIKRKLIGGKRFNTKVTIGEDLLFFLSVLPDVKAWSFDNVGMYHYYIREGSAMQSVDVEKRIGILWENIRHIQGLTNSLNLQSLQKSIVYKSYVVLLCNYRHKLGIQDKAKLKDLFDNMEMRDLKYIDFITKLKLLVYKSLL